MPRKNKTEPDLKVQEFISKSNDQSSSEDEAIELVIQKVRRPEPVIPETMIPVPPKRIRKKYPKTPIVVQQTGGLLPDPVADIPVISQIPTGIPPVVLPDYQAEAKLLREELDRTKKGLHDAKKENLTIRKNDLDTRREMMRLRFG